MYTGLTVFDVDHTLLKVNSSYQFGAHLYRKGFYGAPTLGYCLFYYFLHKTCGISVDRLHNKIFERLFKGRSKEEIEKESDEFFELELVHLLSQGVVERLNKALSRGNCVALVSSSPDFVVNPLGRWLKVTECFATRYGVDDTGKYDRVVKVMGGVDKAECVQMLAERLGIPRVLIEVYSDSSLDLPMMNVAGRAVGVNPDRKLRRTCVKSGWEIME